MLHIKAKANWVILENMNMSQFFICSAQWIAEKFFQQLQVKVVVWAVLCVILDNFAFF